MAKYSNGLVDKLDIPYESVKVLEKRYLKRDGHGRLVETGEDMFRRVAKDIASAEVFYDDKFKGKVGSNISTEELYKLSGDSEKAKYWEGEFFEIMKNRYFLPNSPTLMNAGRELQQLSGCFVLPIEDSIEDIFETQKNMAVVHKSGGGTGFSFSKLRPNGAYVNSTSGYSPGPVSFLFTYNESAGQITQGGKRRGANMGIVNASHPDALDWATIKKEEGVLKNFNLSVAFSDEDMKAVREDGYILMKDPRGKGYGVKNAKNRAKEIEFGKEDMKYKTSWKLSEDEKTIINNYSGKEIGKVENGKIYIKAKSIFEVVVDGTWNKGEPGIIFLDRMNQHNPTPKIGEIESTNPCGEQPLLPYESCNLGSINLSEMFKEEKFDESLLEKTVRTSVRFLDNVIDRNKYPLGKNEKEKSEFRKILEENFPDSKKEQIESAIKTYSKSPVEELTKANRKIGLGIMGFAHMLIKKGISYNSKDAIKEAEYIMKFINDISKDESGKIAEEKGTFPNFKESIYKNGKPLRNATTTTIAPTGTIGVIASTSQGIEPLYALVAERNVEKTIGENLIETDREFKKFLEKEELYDENILEKITKGGGIEDLLIPKKIKDRIKSLFVTAHEIPSDQHLNIQAAFQRYVDNAVSKTINMPQGATKEDVANAYLKAHELGCKGITIYRDKSRDFQLLNAAGGNNSKKSLIDLTNGERPIVIGTTKKQKTPLGNAFVTLNVLKDNTKIPYEVFTPIGKGGKDINSMAEGYGRLISLCFKHSIPLDEIVGQLEGISGETQSGIGPKKVLSVPDAIAKVLREEYKELNNGSGIKETESKPSGNLCPDCGKMLIHAEGCE
ncbi:MAG: ribonucleotide reductase N-terminal alpha domain-containing protein, partial [Nanoarchaeota archaeon]